MNWRSFIKGESGEARFMACGCISPERVVTCLGDAEISKPRRPFNDVRNEYNPVGLNHASKYREKRNAESLMDWYIKRGGFGDFKILEIIEKGQSAGKPVHEPSVHDAPRKTRGACKPKKRSIRIGNIKWESKGLK